MLDLSPLGLIEPPFSLSPDPRYFYVSLQHKATLAKVTYATEQRQGLSVIFGDVGVGKTTIMALLACQFRKQGKEVLVIDADPSPHMAQTIGIKDIGRIKPIAEMTELLVERSGKVEGSPFYQVNPQVDDLLQKFMIEQDNIRLMVLGAIQTAEGGCA